ncbi:MAG: glycosyltransferase [Candidatus Omnitrophica bacterium]|nr:glycosyltransferase [Candidatus Omnitrophota bacterium]
MLTYSVIICTLDRAEDLKRCIASWLKQKPLPHDIVVVHGRQEGILEEELRKLLVGSAVELCYLRMPPSLVRQRNSGIRQAKGDVVFFADDDAVYLDGYAQAILDVYQADVTGSIGGVQGTIENFDLGPAERCGFSKFFLLTCFGNGSLQLSAWPAFCRSTSNLAQVEIFSGPAMSYRKKVLQEFQFNEMFARYWVGDDFEMSYRVSRKYKLFQTSDARLLHYMSPVSRDSERRKCKMVVVNHYFLMRKFFGSTWKSWAYWCWSELGLWMIAVLCLVAGRGPARFLGMIDGYRELWGMRR